MVAKVVVFGLSTEGYNIACKMALNGADVQIIDESTPSAISIKKDIAKTYPNNTCKLRHYMRLIIIRIENNSHSQTI